jgi:hypothetical protein
MRYSIFTNGYVHEDSETITEPKRIVTAKTLVEAEKLLDAYCKKNKTDKSNFHSVKEKEFYNDWETVEGTEIYY